MKRIFWNFYDHWLMPLLAIFFALVIAVMFPLKEVMAAEAADANYAALLQSAERIKKSESDAIQAAAMAQASCAEEIAKAVNGIYVDPESKKVTVNTDQSATGQMARLAGAAFIALSCKGGGSAAAAPSMQPVNVPAPPPPIETGFWAGVKSFARGTWEATVFVADKALQVYGIRSGKDLQLGLATVNKDLQLGLGAQRSSEVIALGGNTATVAVASVDALAAAATQQQQPGTVINVRNNTGPVNIAGRQDSRRICTGGRSEAGTGTATVPAATGQGGAANC